MNQQNSRVVALVGLAVLIALYTMSFFEMFGDNPIGQSSQDTQPFVVPAGYAFAIWGPIYLGLLVFPIFQAINGREEDARWIPFRGWFAANIIANGLWLVAASYNWLWLTVIIILFMLYSLVQMRTLLQQIQAANTPVNFWVEQLPFSLYFGWVTLATALNVASALYFYNWEGFGVDPVTWSAIILIVAASIAFWVATKYRDPAYALVVVWAFVALVVRHWSEVSSLSYLSGGIAVIFTILSLRLAYAPRASQI